MFASSKCTCRENRRACTMVEGSGDIGPPTDESGGGDDGTAALSEWATAAGGEGTITASLCRCAELLRFNMPRPSGFASHGFSVEAAPDAGAAAVVVGASTASNCRLALLLRRLCLSPTSFSTDGRDEAHRVAELPTAV